MKPRTEGTWEHAAREAIERLNLGTHPEGTIEQLNGDLQAKIARAADALKRDSRLAVQSSLRHLARIAWEWLATDGYDLPTVDWMVDKLAEKQASYGTGNILAFGTTGLVVRSSDKVARVTNMRIKNRSSDEEPLFDSLFDLIGYAVIGQMLEDGTFELPLERDTDEGAVLAAAGDVIGQVESAELLRRHLFELQARERFPFLPDDAIESIVNKASTLDAEPDEVAIGSAGGEVVFYRKDKGQ